MRKLAVTILAVFCFTCAFVATAFAEVEKRSFAFHYAGPLGCTNDVFAKHFKKLVEEKSKGRLTVDVFGQNILGTDIEVLAAQKVGKVDFQVTVPAMVVNVIPSLSICDIPWLYNSIEAARAAWQDPTFRPLADAEFEKGGYKLLGTADQCFRVMTTNREIKDVDSFKGMSLRTMENRNQIAFFNALGIKATPLNASEVYLALQQGMLEAQENPYGQAVDRKLWEVQKYVTNSNHTVHTIIFFTGQATWKSLSPEAQKIVQEAADETGAYINEYSNKEEGKFLEQLVAKGMTFIDFDKIPGMREQLREKTYQGAVERARGQVDPKLLDAYLKASGVK